MNKVLGDFAANQFGTPLGLKLKAGLEVEVAFEIEIRKFKNPDSYEKIRNKVMNMNEENNDRTWRLGRITIIKVKDRPRWPLHRGTMSSKQ